MAMGQLRRILARGGAVVLVTAALAACGGGGGGGDDVATLGEGDVETEDDGSGDGGELTDAEREDAMLEFTECMRDHGVDMPDPQVTGDGGGRGGVAIEMNGEGRDMEAFEEADEACGHIIEDAFGTPEEMSPEEEAEMRDNALAFAECMRDNGIDMPDPEFGEGGRGFTMKVGEPGSFDPSDQDFQDAQEACQGELGFEEGRGPAFRVGGGPAGDDERSASNDSSDAEES
jgi:hypothetical protein